jgi:hypothetical protein
MGWTNEESGFDSWQGARNFLLSTTPILVLGATQRGLFPRDKSTSVELTIHLNLVPRLRIVELYLRSPIRLHGVVLN